MVKSEHAQNASASDTPVGLRARKKKEKLRRIEESAAVLFAEQGFQATTTRQIARGADIGAGTLFVYFPQKRDLLVHLLVRQIGGVWSRAFAGLDTKLPLVDALMHVFGALYDHYARDKRLSRVFVQELLFVDPADPDPSLTRMTLEFVEKLGSLVSVAKQRGELPSGTAAVAEPEVAYHFFGTYCSNLLGWLGGTMPEPSHRWMLRRSLELYVAGMQGVEGGGAGGQTFACVGFFEPE